MDPKEEPKPGLTDENLADLVREGERSRSLKKNMQIRVAGFLLLLAALILMILWQKGTLPPIFQTIALGLGGIGFVVYLSARIFSFRKPDRAQRR